MKTTTLAKLRQYGACKPSYDLIAAHVGEDFEGEITLEKALEVLPLKDCIWALQTIECGAEIATEFAIRVAYQFGSVEWKVWADEWLSGEDRSKESAQAAYFDAFACDADAARTAAAAAAYAAGYTTAYAAGYTTAYAAWTTTYATKAAEDKPAELARQTELLKELLK